MSLAQLSEMISLKETGRGRLGFSPLVKEPERAAAAYVITKEAEGSIARVLSALRRGRPGVFWVSGERGAGKTHFLAYLNSILRRPDAAPEGFKDDIPELQMLIIAVEAQNGAHLAQAIATPLCEILKVPRHLSDLWRRLGAEVGLRATLEEIGRGGFKRTLILLDDSGDKGLDLERWRMLSDLAASTRSFKSPALFVVASLGDAPENVSELAVAPKGAREIAALTLAGMRGFTSSGVQSLKTYFDLYSAANATLLDFDEFQSIFPLHERTIDVLDALSRDARRSGVISEIVRETLNSNGTAPSLMSSRRLVMPADLLRSSAARLRIRAAALNQSFESFELALMRLEELELSASDAALASDIIKTLFLTSFIGDQRRRALKVEDLVQLTAFDRPAVNSEKVGKLLATMTPALDGLIVLESDGRARYQPSERPDTFLRRWNEALPILRLVEPELSEADSAATLFAEAEKFRSALGSRGTAIRKLTGELNQLADALGGTPPKLDVLNSFESLLTTGNHEAYIRKAAQVAGGAEALRSIGDEVARVQKLAAAAPRILAVKRYIDLVPPAPTALQPVAGLGRALEAELDFQTLFSHPERADLLSGRFDEFKERYRQLYLEKHSAMRVAVRSFSEKLEQQQRNFALLSRLNTIRELGTAVGAKLEDELKRLTVKLTPCPAGEDPELESMPRCAACDFSFEDGPPLREIESLEKSIAGNLERKLSALARPAVVRVLDEYDTEHRLSGLLQMLRNGQRDEIHQAMNDVTVANMAALLARSRTEADVLIVSRVFSDWPVVCEDDVADLLSAFEATLKEAFAVGASNNGRRRRLALN